MFDLLDELVRSNLRTHGSFGLTECLEKHRQDAGLAAVLLKGVRFDIGLSGNSYVAALNSFGRS